MVPRIARACILGSALSLMVACSNGSDTARGTVPPDEIYVNATVITMDQTHPSAEAVAVRGDSIAAVGSASDIRKMAGAATKVVDLTGNVLLPGFVDAHSHFPWNGTTGLYSVNLSSPPLGPINDIADLVAALKKTAAETAKGEWIQGWGYDQTLLKEGRHPTRTDLDKASTDHPMIITHASGHLSVANSQALALAGVTRKTAQPKGAVIVRDPQTGEPNGVLEETDAGIGALIPPLTDEKRQEAFKYAVQEYVRAGVTTATITGYLGKYEDYERARHAGLLPFRVFAMPMVQLATAPATPAAMKGDDLLKTGLAVKIVHDGSIQGYTGYLTKPYHVAFHGDTSYRGYPRESREELVELVKKLNRAGYQIAIHANGDAAIDDVIEAYRAALKDFPRADVRFRIEHAQMAREDQLDAMKELGITPSFFVSHTYYWGDQHRDIFMGSERAAHISPLASAIKRGLRFSIHLDTPVTPMSPLQAVWSAVNRLTRSGQVLGPEQRITPLEALRAVTIDAAWQIHEENRKGSIAPGKFADLVVLAQNPLTIDPVKIKDISVVETIVGGKSIYANAGASLATSR